MQYEIIPSHWAITHHRTPYVEYLTFSFKAWMLGTNKAYCCEEAETSVTVRTVTVQRGAQDGKRQLFMRRQARGRWHNWITRYQSLWQNAQYRVSHIEKRRSRRLKWMKNNAGRRRTHSRHSVWTCGKQTLTHLLKIFDKCQSNHVNILSFKASSTLTLYT